MRRVWVAVAVCGLLQLQASSLLAGALPRGASGGGPQDAPGPRSQPRTIVGAAPPAVKSLTAALVVHPGAADPPSAVRSSNLAAGSSFQPSSSTALPPSPQIKGSSPPHARGGPAPAMAAPSRPVPGARPPLTATAPHPAAPSPPRRVGSARPPLAAIAPRPVATIIEPDPPPRALQAVAQQELSQLRAGIPCVAFAVVVVNGSDRNAFALSVFDLLGIYEGVNISKTFCETPKELPGGDRVVRYSGTAAEVSIAAFAAAKTALSVARDPVPALSTAASLARACAVGQNWRFVISAGNIANCLLDQSAEAPQPFQAALIVGTRATLRIGRIVPPGFPLFVNVTDVLDIMTVFFVLLP